MSLNNGPSPTHVKVSFGYCSIFFAISINKYGSFLDSTAPTAIHLIDEVLNFLFLKFLKTEGFNDVGIQIEFLFIFLNHSKSFSFRTIL